MPSLSEIGDLSCITSCLVFSWTHSLLNSVTITSTCSKHLLYGVKRETPLRNRLDRQVPLRDQMPNLSPQQFKILHWIRQVGESKSLRVLEGYNVTQNGCMS